MCFDASFFFTQVFTVELRSNVTLQNLGKYFKQSAKALEKKVAREARFYGALIR